MRPVPQRVGAPFVLIALALAVIVLSSWEGIIKTILVKTNNSTSSKQIKEQNSTASAIGKHNDGDMTTPISSFSASPCACLKGRGEHGRWIQDWQYANRTDYVPISNFFTWHYAAQNFTPTLPQQPFRYATSWRWQDDLCPVKEVSLHGFCQACFTLQVTRVLIVGDSLSSEFAHSLESLLGYPPRGRRNTRFQNQFRPLTIDCPAAALHSQKVNQSKAAGQFRITFLLYRRSPLSDILALGKEAENTTAHKNNPQRQFVEDNPHRTIIFANVGAWLHTMDDYKKGFDSLVAWIDSFDPSKTIPFFRDTVPGHLGCKPMDGNRTYPREFNWINPVFVDPYQNYSDYVQTTAKVKAQTNGTEDDYQWSFFEDYNSYSKHKLSNRSAQVAKIHWVNVFNSTVLRRDGHTGFHDCLHYYLPGPTDWWAHFFYSSLLDISNLYEHGSDFESNQLFLHQSPAYNCA